jgi:glucose-1-phosphate thymidylyltransferase
VKALVLSGGAGTRLRPITHTSAKQLVPLANKPILFYGLEAIAACGVTDVGIVVGDTQPDIEAAVGDGSALGLNVTFLRQEEPLGLAHAVLIARDFLGDEPFVMYLGDNLIMGGIGDFVGEFAAECPDALVLLTKVEHPEQFGVAELAPDGRLVRLVEKPPEPPSDLALVGVYLFGPAIHDAVRAIEPSDRGELEITDAIQWLIESGRSVRSHMLDRPWIDTGKRQDLLEANRIVLEALTPHVDGSVDAGSRLTGTVVVEAGAEVVRSVVRGPVVIGAGTRVVDSYVGPFTSIGAACTLTDAEIEHSVVLDGSTITGVRRIDESLIGRGVTIARGGDGPRAYRLLLGDDSEIDIP